MALPNPPINPNTPIPNSPFYYPEGWSLNGPVGPLVVGAGLNISPAGVISAAGGGGGAVASVSGIGPGISVTPTTGNVVISNTGVTSLIAGLGMSVNVSTGAVTITNTGVRTLLTGAGLTGGPITSIGTISLSDTGVTAATYTYPSITVDGKGRITAAISGTTPSTTVTSPIVNTGTSIEPNIAIQVASTGQLGAVQVGTNINVSGLGVISVNSSSTSQAGIVQLNDTVTSCSVTEALTANQGRLLQDQISSLAFSTNLTFAGTFDASTSQMVSVSQEGSLAGFTVGSDLPSPVPGLADYFVIISTGGTYSPPGGGSFTVVQGDWLLCNGTIWQFLNVGADLPIASTGTAGIVRLATVPETQAGTSTALAVTPAGAASTYLPISLLTGKGALVSATAANNPSTVTVGTDGQVLTACGACSSGLFWCTLPESIPCACITGKGALISGTGAGAVVTLPVGTNGQLICANSAIGIGLEWFTPDYVSESIFTAKGNILAADNSASAIALPVGTDGTVLTACSAAPSGLCWSPASTPAIPCACLVAKGSLVTATSAATPVNLPVGTDGQALVVCDACPSGLTWATPAVAVTDATPTVAGIVLGCTTASNTALGCNAFSGVTTGTSNVAIGCCAGADITSGSQNVIIGPATTALSATGSCQLAIGFAAGQNWLIGDCDKNIQPGAGLKDCTGSVGVSGQYLASNGTNLVWATGIGDTPVGTVNWFAATMAPVGWLVADGRAISRSAYAALFAVIGTTYGTGDGSTTFNIPDLRGMFTRGWDAAGGTARGCDTGRAFGSTQQDMFECHQHDLRVNTFDYNVGFLTCRAALGLACNQMTTASKPNNTPYCCVLDPANPTQSAILVSGGTETRPMNVAMLPCIKYEVTVAPATPSACGIPCACITGKGAIITGTGADTPTALPVGNNGQVLVACSGCVQGITWCDTSLTAINAAASYNVTAGTITSGNAAAAIVPGVNGVAITVDSNACGWLNVTNGRFTPTVAGYYQVNAQVSATNSNGNVWAGILCNGSIYGQAISSCTPNSTWYSSSYSAVVYLNGSTDYLQMGAAFQNGTPTFATVSGMTRFSAALIGGVTTLPATYQISQAPSFTSAGTVQSVGIGTVISGTTNPGTAPTITAASQNNIRYRQIGPKEWEVQGILFQTGGTGGNGDYVLTLPAGLQFDLSSPYQQAYTIGPNFAAGWYSFGLPNAWAMFSQSGAVTIYQSVIMPFDATRYRIVPVGPNSEFFWSNAYYGIGNYNGWRKWGFTFFSP